MRGKLLLVILLSGYTSADAQSVTDIEKKYGQRKDVYSVSEHIWMTPEYASDGQVCRMRLYPKRVDGDTSFVGAMLQYTELRDLLNSIVPPNTRGLKSKLNFGATATGGPASWTTYPYENVTFTFTSSFLPLKFVESSPLRRGEYRFQKPKGIEAGEIETQMPTNDDFSASESSNTEIVVIQWNGRKCR
ncbi:MAG TPA: hypothetical protein VFR78_07800 [Pyrinomonadaceae bacterium]|nr:hypothetical protein [Pyrinomonadaceae bacterium]